MISQCIVFSSPPLVSSQCPITPHNAICGWRELSSLFAGVSFCLWCEKLVSCFNKLRREKRGKSQTEKALTSCFDSWARPLVQPRAPRCLKAASAPDVSHKSVKIVENSARCCCPHLLQIYIQSPGILVHVVENFLTTKGLKPPSSYGQLTIRACKV